MRTTVRLSGAAVNRQTRGVTDQTFQTGPGLPRPGLSIPCVGGIVIHSGRLLLIQRGNAPSKGLWSIPGGRLLMHETLHEGCVRELLEETGLHVIPVAEVGSVQRMAPGGDVYDIHDLLCWLHPGYRVPQGRPAGDDLLALPEPTAGDDALQAAWYDRAGAEALDDDARMAPGVLDALRDWGMLDLLV